MLIQSSPLGAQIASFQAANAAQETRAWLPATLHALIAAIFARIFGRLEQLIALWQSGTLPPASIPRPQSQDAATAPHPTSPGASHRANPTTRTRATTATPAAIIHTTPSPPRTAPSARSITSVIPSAAKDARCLLPPNQPRRIRPGRAPPRANPSQSPPCNVAQPRL